MSRAYSCQLLLARSKHVQRSSSEQVTRVQAPAGRAGVRAHCASWLAAYHLGALASKCSYARLSANLLLFAMLLASWQHAFTLRCWQLQEESKLFQGLPIVRVCNAFAEVLLHTGQQRLLRCWPCSSCQAGNICSQTRARAAARHVAVACMRASCAQSASLAALIAPKDCHQQRLHAPSQCTEHAICLESMAESLHALHGVLKLGTVA